ncbi:hypothetical protein VTL71DRAFT_10625 [Oculimacula yallundae]|uniref:Uncharacterized protein n=1 Tax=Oculimacula yallundae TaxID=86028 RepID=A0ABR4CTN3_9HELO
MSTFLTFMRSTNPAPGFMITLMSLNKILHDSSEASLSLRWRLMDRRMTTDDNLSASVQSVFVPQFTSACSPWLTAARGQLYHTLAVVATLPFILPRSSKHQIHCLIVRTIATMSSALADRTSPVRGIELDLFSLVSLDNRGCQVDPDIRAGYDGFSAATGREERIIRHGSVEQILEAHTAVFVCTGSAT